MRQKLDYIMSIVFGNFAKATDFLSKSFKRFFNPAYDLFMRVTTPVYNVFENLELWIEDFLADNVVRYTVAGMIDPVYLIADLGEEIYNDWCGEYYLRRGLRLEKTK